MALTTMMVKEHMKKGTVVVNVLDENTYADLHIKGSINIPLKSKSDDDFAKDLEDRVGRDWFIITHCSGPSCQAGPRAAQILKARGFKVEDYPGGLEEWSAAKLPMEGRKLSQLAS